MPLATVFWVFFLAATVSGVSIIYVLGLQSSKVCIDLNVTAFAIAAFLVGCLLIMLPRNIYFCINFGDSTTVVL